MNRTLILGNHSLFDVCSGDNSQLEALSVIISTYTFTAGEIVDEKKIIINIS